MFVQGVFVIPLSVTLWIQYIYGCQWTEKDIDDINKRIFARFVFPNCSNNNKLQQKYKIKKDEIINFGNDIDKYITIGIAKCEYYRRRANCVIDERYDDNKNNENNTNNNDELINDAQRVFDEILLLIQENISSS